MEIPVIIINFDKMVAIPVKRCKLLWYKAYKYAKRKAGNKLGNSKKRKKKKVGITLGMIAIALVVLVLLGGLMLESNDLKERLTGYDAKAATSATTVEDEQTRTEEIDKLKKYMRQTNMQKRLPEKLGLVRQ